MMKVYLMASSKVSIGHSRLPISGADILCLICEEVWLVDSVLTGVVPDLPLCLLGLVLQPLLILSALVSQVVVMVQLLGVVACPHG